MTLPRHDRQRHAAPILAATEAPSGAMSYRISVDTGGTFTDVVVADPAGAVFIGKELTTYTRAFDSVRNALEKLAPQIGISPTELLASTGQFAYGTTRSTNAIVEAKTAKTAFLTTEGFPDTLLLREGGKIGPFTPADYRPPFVPRYLTFEIRERIDAEGDPFIPLDESSVLEAIERCRAQNVEAVGVSFLWATVNPAHEIRVGELLAEHLPEAAVTLSHALNPIIREYRRSSSTVIDASLKPLMQRFLRELDDDLRDAGFAGQLLISTSFGGSWPVGEMVRRPIYSIGSGPSMAPVAGLACGRDELADDAPDLLVCDTGGTSFDVSLISSGEIHQTTETWIGGRWTGHITGTRAVDVRSIGAGGGSIVGVDAGGLLLVGPESAGADPGPACYGRGGERPTVTDAAAILGYLDPESFLDGRLVLDTDAARRAFEPVAEALGKSVEGAAQGAMIIATQNEVAAIREITIAQGIDPRVLTIVAGGGASGLNIIQVARELGSRRVVLPRSAGALSATGALLSDIIGEFAATHYSETRNFDWDGVNSTLADAEARAEAFLDSLGPLNPTSVSVEAAVDARYAGQVWELETRLPGLRVRTDEDLAALEAAFHEIHENVFAVKQPGQYLECLLWKARATAELEKPELQSLAVPEGTLEAIDTRRVVFTTEDRPDTAIYAGDRLPAGVEIEGPAVIVEPTTTLIIDPGALVRVSPHGNYVIDAQYGDEVPGAGAREEALVR